MGKNFVLRNPYLIYLFCGINVKVKVYLPIGIIILKFATTRRGVTKFSQRSGGVSNLRLSFSRILSY